MSSQKDDLVTLAIDSLTQSLMKTDSPLAKTQLQTAERLLLYVFCLQQDQINNEQIKNKISGLFRKVDDSEFWAACLQKVVSALKIELIEPFFGEFWFAKSLVS